MTERLQHTVITWFVRCSVCHVFNMAAPYTSVLLSSGDEERREKKMRFCSKWGPLTVQGSGAGIMITTTKTLMEGETLNRSFRKSATLTHRRTEIKCWEVIIVFICSSHPVWREHDKLLTSHFLAVFFSPKVSCCSWVFWCVSVTYNKPKGGE